jgi:uncharacterized protein (TIGR00369 family)
VRFADRVDEVRERFERSEFHTAFLGLRLDRVAEGRVDISLELEPRHLNLVGTLHGGMIATLADTATGLAYRTVLEPGTTHVTSSLSVVFLAAARAGTITASGRVVRRGARFGYAEADVMDAEGTLLARASATFTVLPERDQ